MLTLGVDGCKEGWVAVHLRAPEGCAPGEGLSLDWSLHGTVSALLDSPAGREAAMIVIDVPVGLSDGPPRACDAEARARIGPRRSSVFPPPMRAMLAMKTRAEASRYGQSVRRGGGLSAQAWNITPKIAEVDATMTPALQARVREGHPEVAFARLGGAPMAHAKKRAEGRAERRAVLAVQGLAVDDVLTAILSRRPRPAAEDDVLDAAVLALTARDVALGRDVWVLGGDRDARGLRMEILG